ncbi:hypothetical protein F503_04794 [Ophiostoma piceae UAMH 11346]|uniref:Uncharacterized protein n=1 Tax=Ophiostoma piceae (strain UAMH 11346) TaxID=1262450 RepID=S3BWW0_OPHP1|nr:hypothetical protein F503_04794 [Ophiostoma piceae UAMH 11346]
MQWGLRKSGTKAGEPAPAGEAPASSNISKPPGTKISGEDSNEHSRGQAAKAAAAAAPGASSMLIAMDVYCNMARRSSGRTGRAQLREEDIRDAGPGDDGNRK